DSLEDLEDGVEAAPRLAAADETDRMTTPLQAEAGSLPSPVGRALENVVIRLERIHKTYHLGDIDVHALRGVSLSIRRGEFVAIMGPSGSGKSTMMNVIGCLDRPTKGQYLLEGADVSKVDKAGLADIRNKHIGFVFQSFNL